VVQGNEGRADFERAQQKAKQIRILAEAEAEQVARVGVARAVATEEQVRAYGGPSFQVTQQVMQAFADAVKESKVEVVPRMLVGGGAAGGGGLLESLMAVLLSDKFMAAGLVDNQRESSSKANAIRAQLEGLK
jgi:regulator of protease activity HflC (stomatin/prohibitin superfamily)